MAFCIGRSDTLPRIVSRLTPSAVARHEEGLDLPVGGVAREHREDVGASGAADPALGAVDDPLVALAPRRRGQAAGDVAAVVGFGQCEHPGQREGADQRIEFGDLLGRTAERDRGAEEPGLRVVERGHRGVGAGEDEVAEPAEEARRCFPFGHAGRLHEVERDERLQDGVGHGRRLPRLGQQRTDALVEHDLQSFERVARGRAEVLGESVAIGGEVHDVPSPPVPAGGPRCPS